MLICVTSGLSLPLPWFQGTVIRVYRTPSGERLFELRRGLATNATIYSMAFDITSTLLCVSSNHQTIHIFKLETMEPEPPSKDESSWSASVLLQVAVDAASSMLPTPVSDMWMQARSFAQVRHTCFTYLQQRLTMNWTAIG